MRRLSRAFLALALLTTALALPACDTDEPDAPGAPEVTVMSYNVYLGFNIFTLLEADDLIDALTLAGESYRALLRTDFPARAGVLADQIERTDPALVGLQEVSLYRTQQGSDFLQNQAVNADSVFLDFLAILRDSLSARGLQYRTAAAVENADVELPVDVGTTAGGTRIQDVRLTDRDVILARSGVQTSAVETGNYEAAASFNVGGAVGVDLVRGYAKVRTSVNGATFTFVNSHVEGLMPAHEAQINELETILDGYAGPVVLTGDLNTPADGSGPPGYAILVENGAYTDADAEARAGDAEPTCCVNETLRGDSFSEKRIDFVLYRGEGVEAVSAEVVGDEPSDKTPSGLWPSDHAGVAATLRFEE